MSTKQDVEVGPGHTSSEPLRCRHVVFRGISCRVGVADRSARRGLSCSSEAPSSGSRDQHALLIRWLVLWAPPSSHCPRPFSILVYPWGSYFFSHPPFVPLQASFSRPPSLLSPPPPPLC
ncbi:hypothetical protein BHE74_00028380 [Ensete ventricosum]|nr:hypothetical protein GW17_00029766 [Ensete ventricosum]RWW64386.1 hypothetical protein BHE74_00028380 [Ensete ventricosum]RZS03440.1 hypothetical protein BHM03_00033619 [Ensete ventricosum]